MNEDASWEDQKLFEELRLLPLHDVDQDRSRQIVTLSLAILRSRSGYTSKWLPPLDRLYTRFLEPLWVAAFSAAFLVWAFSCAARLLR